MTDHVKASTENQHHITRLYSYAKENLQIHKAQNNNYEAYSSDSTLLLLQFRKILSKGKICGFRSVDICFKPHYIFNDGLHNGNDFSPLESSKLIRELFKSIGIIDTEFRDFKIVNLEYGLNIKPDIHIQTLISGILYTNKKIFLERRYENGFFKISFTTQFKQIKAYAKGLQFAHYPHYDIDKNTFRFEVKAKKHDKIKRVGIETIADLTNPIKYAGLFKSILDEWENVLIINKALDNKESKLEYWQKLIESQRNKFSLAKKKYYDYLEAPNNLHHQIKCKIIDKLVQFQDCADCPQKNPINIEKINFANIAPH